MPFLSTGAVRRGLPHTAVAALSRRLLWRALLVVFVTVTVSEFVVARLEIRSFLLNSSITAAVAMALALPLLFGWVILPVVRLITIEARAAAEGQIRAVLESVSDAVIISDLKGQVLFANRAMHRLLGYTAGILAGKRTMDTIPEAHRRMREADIEAFLAGRPCTLLNQGAQEGVAQRASGEHFPVELTWSSLPASGPAENTHFVAIMREITARKKTEAALRESELLFRTLADTAPAMIWMADAAGNLNFLSKGWLDFRGRTMEQELSFGWAEGLHPDDYGRCLEVFDKATRAREPYETEYRLRRHDGEFRWLLDRGVPRWDADGGLAGFIGVCVDVTVRKQAEEALRASERRFRELLEGLPVAVRIVQDEKIVFANLADAHLHGYARPEDEIGLPSNAHIAPADTARMEDMRRKRMAGETVPKRYEIRRRRTDGSEVLAEVEADRTCFNGRPAILLVIRDLTDRKRVEFYEKLLPVCCVCGKIRNDIGKEHGAGAWQRLDQYLARYSDAEFSHTFCPDCFGEYRRKNLSG